MRAMAGEEGRLDQKPDAWAIHFGNGERCIVWDDETKASLMAARLHGTKHPMAYLDGTPPSQKPERS